MDRTGLESSPRVPIHAETEDVWRTPSREMEDSPTGVERVLSHGKQEAKEDYVFVCDFKGKTKAFILLEYILFIHSVSEYVIS